jgi:hypothetical protein
MEGDRTAFVAVNIYRKLHQKRGKCLLSIHFPNKISVPLFAENLESKLCKHEHAQLDQSKTSMIAFDR